jgi:transcriptional regulator with XRE-family HTH domain
MESHFDPKHRRVRALLRAIRIERNLRQIDVAERLGQEQSFVSKYENGERQLDFVEIAEVCEALGISLTEFVRRFEEGAP